MPITPASQPFTLVTDVAGMHRAARELAHARRFALDTEANSRHRFPERVCLLQAATASQAYLLDPLAVPDLPGLGAVLADPSIEKVLHGADYDLRGLNRDWGFTLRNVYDTDIAARFAGQERTGLSALLEDILGINIPKEATLQKSDWTRRPLSDDALAYAASDVAHLLELRASLDRRLIDLGRAPWIAEEFAHLEEVRHTPPDPATAFLSVKGSRVLDGKGLAALRALHEFRDAEARRIDRPPSYILHDTVMVYLAANPEADFSDVPGLVPVVARRLGGGIRKVLTTAAQAAPYSRPAPAVPPLPRPTPSQVRRLGRLKDWRVGEGKRLSMDPSLLWPMRSLERLARAPGSLDEELEAPEVRRWQRAQFADAVGAILRQ